MKTKYRNNEGIFLALAANLLVVLLLFTGCAKDTDDVPTPNLKNQTMGIVVMNNASLRVDPYLYSSRLLLLNKGDIVTIKDQSKVRQWIGKKHDYWYNIEMKNGISGWMFGSTLDIVDSSNSDAVKSYLDQFWMEQSDSVRKEIAGKWWSLNSVGDFTNHGIELTTDGKYVSYRKGGKNIEGTYSLNFHENEIIFLDGTSFGKNLYFIRRGQSYVLADDREEASLQFKKISEFDTNNSQEDEKTDGE